MQVDNISTEPLYLKEINNNQTNVQTKESSVIQKEVTQIEVDKSEINKKNDISQFNKISLEEAEEKKEDKKNLKRTEEEQEKFREEISENINELNKYFKTFNSRLSFSFNEDVNLTVIELRDRETSEVLKQMPPEELLESLSKMSDIAGFLVDRMA